MAIHDATKTLRVAGPVPGEAVVQSVSSILSSKSWSLGVVVEGVEVTLISIPLMTYD